MDTVKQVLWAQFSETTPGGIDYFLSPLDMKDFLCRSPSRIVIGEIEVLVPNMEQEMAFNAAQLDKEIADLQLKITLKEDTKKKLLAIEAPKEL